ncbi:MAG: Holliday junction resolvase RuvX [Gammaproteobacteria bacterium]|nr:Holliday junction resolvase RuvX [Gammaproteobacteria bacterium]
MPERTATYLAFDYGSKQIGVAVGGSHSGLAESLANVQVGRSGPDWAHISRLIAEWRPAALVVGLPLNMDDSENTMTAAARKFGNRLQGRYNLPVHMVDERLTSVAAKNALVEAGVPFARRKARVDKLAAQAILQAFLDEQADSHGRG